MFENVTDIIACLYLAFMAFIIKTENLKSSVFFKFIPFIIMVCLLFVLFQKFG